MLNTTDPFGGDMKTCSVTTAFMADNADVLVPQGLTEASLSGAQAKGQLGVAFAKVAKGEIKKYAKIAEGSKPDGTTLSLTYQGTVKVSHLKGEVHSYEIMKHAPGKQPQFYNAGENSAFLQQIMDEASWKFGNASKPTVAAGPNPAKASVGAMSDEEVSTLFVVIKDQLAKEQGLNIKGSNPALDALVHKQIGEKVGYTAQEVFSKIEAYKATGKKLSALKKKALKDKPKLPPKPKPATKPDDLETIEDLLKPVGAKAADPYPEASDAAVKNFTDLMTKHPGEIPWLKSIALNKSGTWGPKDVQLSQKALKNKGLDWSDEPMGVPTQATKSLADELTDDLSSSGLMHDHYTPEDLAAQYIMAKDKVVADSNGKWTLYTKSEEMDQEIYAMINAVTGQNATQVKKGVADYLSSGKKLSVLKKQLIKSGSMKKAAPTLKGGTKATKGNSNAFADKGFNPPGYVPAKLDEKMEGNLYQSFKTNGLANYLTSPEKDLIANMQKIQAGFAKDPYNLDLTLLDIVRAIDKAGAKKFGVTNEHLFEKKIVPWVASPQGQEYLLAKEKAENLLKNMPPLPADSKAFDVISTQHALAMQNRMTPWTPDQQSGLRHYTTGAYGSINSYLRGRTTYINDRDKRAIEEGKAGMRTVDESFLVRRGCDFRQFPGYESYEEVLTLVGKTIADKGFLSTSVGGEGAFSGSVKMEVEVVKGTKGSYVDHISAHRGEREFIIAPETKLKVLRVEQVGYQTIVRVRTVP